MVVSESLQTFFDTQRQRYGEFFWYDQMDLGSGKIKIIVMLESIAKKARAICNDINIEIVSFEYDETIGDFYRAQKDGVALYTLPLREQNMDIVHTYNKDERFVWQKDLMQDELVRCYSPNGYTNWYATVAYHSFDTQAPRALGWMHQDDLQTKLTRKAFAQPKQLQDFAKMCESLEHIPYCMGSKSREHGFDCSGLVQHITYYTKGIWLPRMAAWQALVCSPIMLEQIRQGDLIFFKKTGEEGTCGERRRTIDHVVFVYQLQQGKLPIVFHTEKLIGKAAFQDLNMAKWLSPVVNFQPTSSLPPKAAAENLLQGGQWEIAGYGRIDETKVVYRSVQYTQ